MRILWLGHQPEDPADEARAPRLKKILATYTSPGTEVTLAYPDDFVGGRVITRMAQASLYTGLHHSMATAALIRKAVWAEQQGFDAVIQSNHFDPATEATKWAVRIPVIGLFRNALHVATMFADRVGILVPLDPHIPLVRRILRTYGMDGFVADIRSLDTYRPNAELNAMKEQVFAKSVGMMKAMVEESQVEYIIPLGGALVPQVISAVDLQREVGVPVTDNYGLGIHVAEMAVRAGLTHSARTYPPMNAVRPEDYEEVAFPGAVVH
jgi:allantoin racemase